MTRIIAHIATEGVLLMTNLQQKRKDARMTQRELAAGAGVSVRTLQHYEQGALNINKAAGAMLYRLAQALDCAMEDLLEKGRDGLE